MHDLFYREDIFRDYDHAAKRARGIDFTIDYQGRWYFHGVQNPGPIKRKALAALFGGAGSGFMAGKGLQTDEAGAFFLKSPEGRYGVEVEDVPFIITAGNLHNNNLVLMTNFEEEFTVGPDHDLVLRPEPHQGIDVFYALVRKGLWGRLTTQMNNWLVTSLLQEDGAGFTLQSGGKLFRFDGNEKH
ncbi:MAG: hypothetical protein ACK4NR_05650 [Micavibrio sp.]